MTNEQRSTKTSDGCYLYRGYRIEHADNREYGGDDGWNVFAPNTESCDDRFNTLRDSKFWIDSWLARHSN
jgi:hypothetical protein